MKRVEVILNACGGSFVEGQTDEAVRQAFIDAGVEINLRLLRTGEDLTEAAEQAVNGDADIIVAGGGDGTISGVAAVVAASGKTLGILPLGTLNHFSKDLNIPAELDAAAELVARGHIDRVDIGEVNGRTFINNSSIGLYPRIVRHRESQQERLGRGKWSAAFFAVLRVLRIDSFLRVRLITGAGEILRKTPFVFVGNNEYQMDIYNIGKRPSVKDGKLSVYILQHNGRWGVVRLVLKTLIGRLEQAREFEALTTDELTIRLRRKKRLLVAIDGEVTAMETPLEYKIMPRHLSVLVPVPEEAA